MVTAPRFARPTGQPRSSAGAEMRADPDGLQHVRTAPPIDHCSYAANTAIDCVAQSKARHTDSVGDGSGDGRAGTGWQLLTAGTVTVTTGAGQTESYQGQAFAAGMSFVGEITNAQSTGILVITW